MQNTKIGTIWTPDIRPDSVDTFTETYTPEGGEQQTHTYKAVDNHPVLNRVLDKLAFFRTHAGAVWYNLQERKTLLSKLNEQDAVIEGLNAKIATKTGQLIPADGVNGNVSINQIKKSGNVVNLFFNITDINISNQSPIAIVPQEFRPTARTVQLLGMAIIEGVVSTITFSVTTSGILYNSWTTRLTTSAYIFGTYII